MTSSSPVLPFQQVQIMKLRSNEHCNMCTIIWSAVEHANTSPDGIDDVVEHFGSGNGNGAAQFRAIVEAEFVHNAGHNKGIVSFQRIIIPMLNLIIKSRNSIHHKQKKRILMILCEAAKPFFDQCMECIQALITNGQYHPEPFSSDDILFQHANAAVNHWGDIILPVLDILNLLMTNNKDFLSEQQEWIEHLVNRLQTLCSSMQPTDGYAREHRDSVDSCAHMFHRLQRLLSRGKQHEQIISQQQQQKKKIFPTAGIGSMYYRTLFQSSC